MKKEVSKKLNEIAKQADALVSKIDKLRDYIANNSTSDVTPAQKADRKLVVILAAGHGGMQYGNYMTNPLDGKKYTFTNVTPHETAYEGVINRKLANAIHHKLVGAGFRVCKVYDHVRDLPLQEVTAMENSIFETISGKEKSIYLSIHHNALGKVDKGDGESPRGWCCFIYGGKTSYSKKGYEYASEIEKHQRLAITDYNIDMPLRDAGTFHKQNQAIWTNDIWWELRKTKSPAVLIEGGFFTNYQDFKIIESDRWINISSDAYVNAMIEIDKSL